MAYSASNIATCATATANTDVSVSIEDSVSSGLETSRDNLSGTYCRDTLLDTSRDQSRQLVPPDLLPRIL